MSRLIMIIELVVILALFWLISQERELCTNSCEIWCNSKCPLCSAPDRYYDPDTGQVLSRTANLTETVENFSRDIMDINLTIPLKK